MAHYCKISLFFKQKQADYTWQMQIQNPYLTNANPEEGRLQIQTIPESYTWRMQIHQSFPLTETSSGNLKPVRFQFIPCPKNKKTLGHSPSPEYPCRTTFMNWKGPPISSIGHDTRIQSTTRTLPNWWTAIKIYHPIKLLPCIYLIITLHGWVNIMYFLHWHLINMMILFGSQENIISKLYAILCLIY